MIRVFSRQGCHLCELLLEELLPIVRGYLAVEVVDIDTQADWQAAYDTRVPVVEYRNRPICEYTLDRDAIRSIIRALPGS